ncbi:hypothetical protein [Microbacterium amylolyticum]|uniref:Uncharacterized protein n=1 Tax=Microbacterium amylolyticum TaxID=936337 RepID=A0ABS4ZIV9_9MICO|nr:hypothetical protein [Microbacterium amylolyticum]MBP2436958.1 hypothetical protein [Microbacterium amylolyticum]
MEWVSDVAVGQWLRDQRAGAWGVPEGFPAYARVFHPAYRERPVGTSWPPPEDAAAWESFAERQPEVDQERVTWRETADALGVPMHPLVRWNDLVGVDPHSGSGDVRDLAGWRYHDPEDGNLEPDVLAATSRHFIAHTPTPDDAYAAVWDGWAEIVGAPLSGGSGAAMRYAGGKDPRHDAVLASSFRDAFGSIFRKPRWRAGILPDDVSRGPRLPMVGRDHILFRAPLGHWEHDSWPESTPWCAPERMRVFSPSLMWPEDRSWVLMTDPDDNSTIIAGSEALIDAICADDAIEALRLAELT